MGREGKLSPKIQAKRAEWARELSKHFTVRMDDRLYGARTKGGYR